MSAAIPLPERVRKIAVVRANGLGDFVFCLPALQALRDGFPKAEIVMLGKPWLVELLRDRPAPVDRVVVIPPARGVGAPDHEPQPPEAERVLERFLERMREERFDLAFQLHGGGQWSNPFVRRLGARISYGLRSPDAEPLDHCIPYAYYQPEVFRYLEVVQLAGVRVREWEPRLQVIEADLAEARAVLPARRPLVVMHLGATDERRRWPVAHFAAVGDALADCGAAIAVTAVGDERALLHALQRAMHHPVIDLGADCSLRRLVGALASADLMIGNDSGPLNLARTVGTATVGIYWCGNLINAGPTTRARHRPLLSWRLNCPECGADTTRQRCPHRPSFVAEVRPDEVIREAMDLLAAADREAQAETPLDRLQA
jgi:ADP-heptose:LPS heptosyltransferase